MVINGENAAGGFGITEAICDEILAAGADAVTLGRPHIYGLAIAGQRGVGEVLDNLLAEIDLTMSLSGASSWDEVDSSLLA